MQVYIKCQNTHQHLQLDFPCEVSLVPLDIENVGIKLTKEMPADIFGSYIFSYNSFYMDYH